MDKTGVINDPLGQTHSLASSEHFFLCFALLDLKSGDGRTTCAKTIISTGRDSGLAKWININIFQTNGENMVNS